MHCNFVGSPKKRNFFNVTMPNLKRFKKKVLTHTRYNKKIHTIFEFPALHKSD